MGIGDSLLCFMLIFFVFGWGFLFLNGGGKDWGEGRKEIPDRKYLRKEWSDSFSWIYFYFFPRFKPMDNDIEPPFRL